MKMTSTFAFNLFFMACIIVAHCDYDKSQAVMSISKSCTEFLTNCRKSCHDGTGYRASCKSKKCTCKGSTNIGGTGNAVGTGNDGDTGSTGVSKPSVFNLDNFRDSMLAKHNELRKKHSAGNLRLEEHLNDIAQAYAEKLARKDASGHNDRIERENSGENLYYSCGMDITGDIVTESWYAGIKDYDLFQPETSGGGDFTQV